MKNFERNLSNKNICSRYGFFIKSKENGINSSWKWKNV